MLKTDVLVWLTVNCIVGSVFEILPRSAVELFCGNSKRVKPVDCFHRGAASLMFDGFLNVTMCEEVSTTGVTQGDHKLPLPPDSLYSHQTQE